MSEARVMFGLKTALVLISVIILLISVNLLPGCVYKETSKTQIKVASLPFLSYANLHIAQEERYFTEQGLEVEFVKFNASSDAIPLLAQGDLDVVTGSVSASLINAIAREINLKIVAGSTYVPLKQSSDSLVVRKDLYQSGELDTVAELKGRQVATTCLGCVMDFALANMLKSAGLSLTDVKITRMTLPNIMAALENKAIDAAVVDGLTSEKAEALGLAFRLITYSEAIPGFQFLYTIFGPNLLTKNPDLGKKFMVAYLKGSRQFNQGKTETNMAIIQKYTGLDKEILLKVNWNPVYIDGRIKVEDILKFQDWAYENGFVDRKMTKEFVDTRFIDYANKVLGPTK